MDSNNKIIVLLGTLASLVAIVIFLTGKENLPAIFNSSDTESSETSVPTQSESDIASFNSSWQSEPTFFKSFALVLQQEGSEIVGYHSAVAQEGNRIDAAIPKQDLPTIYGIVEGNIARVTFNSMYGSGKGDATLVLQGDRLDWIITGDNGEPYYLPRKASMSRVR